MASNAKKKKARGSTIREEIRQQRPFRSPAQETVVSLLRTAAAVERQLTKVVEPAGITLSQYNVLRILRGAGAEGLPTLAIRDRMITLAPGITRLLDRLEAAGLVRRDRSAPDRRQVLCHVTAAGLALLQQLDAPMNAAGDAAAGMLGAKDQRRLLRILDAIRAAD
jgi:DNA-binding MarR family transcriptional regulator